jgi:exodeoxyribonuclease VII large subunit
VLAARLGALNPEAVLERGYAIVRDRETGAVIGSVRRVHTGQELAIRLRDGEIEAVTSGL